MANWLRRQHITEPRILHLAALVGALMHEPRREALAIANGAAQEMRRSLALWQTLARSSRAQARRIADEVEAPELPELAAWMDRSTRGILVTSIHGGEYLAGLLKLRHALRTPRDIYIVRKLAASETERAVFSHFSQRGNDVIVVRHNERRSVGLVKALRRGHIVVALHDLPRSYGPTSDVPFLGQTMAMVKGPAELALLGNADIVNVHSFRSGRRRRLGCYSPVRPRDTISTCETLARLATQHISRYPSQWQHWIHVPEMWQSAHA
ncbi:MAG: hypothetical protein KDI19_04440 [Pseudomonadales bacterium]|nr:hypothetical protein [Pseudomonadales bacterium]